eukprot:7595054-Pyramimonas_sp.AAC.1
MIRDGDNAGVGSDSKGLVIGIPGREERAAFRACARFSTGTRSSWSSTAARRTYNQSQEGKQRGPPCTEVRRYSGGANNNECSHNATDDA